MNVTEQIAALRRQSEELQRQEQRLLERQESELLAAFGANIKRLREAGGLTQQQLADRMGMSRASIANMEGGRQNPPLTAAALLACALGVRLDQLIEDAA